MKLSLWVFQNRKRVFFGLNNNNNKKKHQRFWREKKKCLKIRMKKIEEIHTAHGGAYSSLRNFLYFSSTSNSKEVWRKKYKYLFVTKLQKSKQENTYILNFLSKWTIWILLIQYKNTPLVVPRNEIWGLIQNFITRPGDSVISLPLVLPPPSSTVYIGGIAWGWGWWGGREWRGGGVMERVGRGGRLRACGCAWAALQYEMVYICCG